MKEIVDIIFQTSGSLEGIVLILVCNPTVQAKAQQIMDKVLGGERLPNISDRENPELVYIEAIIMEILR
jgi:hypothetical protein